MRRAPTANLLAPRQGCHGSALRGLAYSFLICSHWRMERLDARHIAEILAEAPVWARLGLGVRHPRMRERAAHRLAEAVVERLGERPGADPDQLVLF